MIATLTGTVTEKLVDLVVLDVGGVGYGLIVTADDQLNLTTGEELKVYIYEHIRENVHDLFGFTSIDAKHLFEQLLNVSSVGPKMAISILSLGSPVAVRQAIATGDTKFIQSAAGVGRRVAERVVVELKDKVGLAGVDLAATGLLQGENNLLQDEAVEALVSLGYSPQDAHRALDKVDTNLPSAERIRLALKGSQ